MKHQQSAHEYRRYIELVQVMASSNPEAGLRALCTAWGIIPIAISDKRLDYGGTYGALAKAVIKHHRSETE